MSDQLQKLTSQIERLTMEFADLNSGHWKLTRRAWRGCRRSWTYAPKTPAVEKQLVSLAEEIARLQAMRSGLLQEALALAQRKMQEGRIPGSLHP